MSTEDVGDGGASAGHRRLGVSPYPKLDAAFANGIGPVERRHFTVFEVDSGR